MQRYFIEQSQVDGNFIFPNDTQTHHITKVMRMTAKDKAEFVISEHRLIVAELISDTPVKFEIIDTLKSDVELPVRVSIATSFLKGEKLELLAQKVTELGASELLVVPTQRSVVKWDAKKRQKKQLRLQKIAHEASEQSHRLKIPKVLILSEFNDLLKRLTAYDLVLIAYEKSAQTGEVSQFYQQLEQFQGQKILVFFGPEGGIADEEIDVLLPFGSLIGLGPRIMRAETAPLYALSAISFYYELKGEG
ncbi:MAG: 16S rRNA (uracil(1498)-N(3))-methyltransferase [Streptococcaceae bacterium]|jgi:16S rRNA (uracil1498-N3)-methyltransferase|nr:16S rRNA (uracil(1498)-N(3))-methyltransferase [Streptococcaceae bacterium]